MSKFDSIYGAGEISPAQRLTEIICERVSEKEQKVLSPFFWDDPYWKKIFKMQIIFANRLIKKFSYEAVFQALQLKEARRVFSFGAPFFIPMVESMQKKIDMHAELVESSVVAETVDTTEAPRKTFKSKNKSLKEKLDG